MFARSFIPRRQFDDLGFVERIVLPNLPLELHWRPRFQFEQRWEAKLADRRLDEVLLVSDALCCIRRFNETNFALFSWCLGEKARKLLGEGKPK